MQNLIKCSILAIMFLGLIVIVSHYYSSEAEPSFNGGSGFIPCIADWQQMLNEIEPENPIEVDGRLGYETQKKWDWIFCNQSAAKSDYMYKGE